MTVLAAEEDFIWLDSLQAELGKKKITLKEMDIYPEKGIEQGIIKVLSEELDSLCAEGVPTVLLMSWQYLKTAGGSWQTGLEQICSGCPAPVVLLSERRQVKRELAGFEAGIADYVTKQDDIRIVAARLQSVLMRYASGQRAADGEDVLFEQATYTVWIQGQKQELSHLEYAVFECLYKNKDTVLKRQFIFREIWGEKPVKDMRVVDTVVKRLRKKIEKTQYVIQSKYKLGYILTKE